MMRNGLIVVVMMLVGFAPAPKEAKDHSKDLEGIWQIESFEIGTGDGVYEPEALYPRMVIKGGWLWKERDLLGEVVRGLKSYLEFPSPKREWFDLKANKEAKMVQMKAIYKREGEKLAIVLVWHKHERAKSTESKLEDSWQRYRLRRMR